MRILIEALTICKSLMLTIADYEKALGFQAPF